MCLKQIVAQKGAKGRTFVMHELKSIANNKVMQSVLSEYPYWKNPLKRALISHLLRVRAVTLIYILLRL